VRAYQTALTLLLSVLGVGAAAGQRVELRPAPPVSLPGISDSNSPVFWWNGAFTVIQSAALPIFSRGPGLLGQLKARAVALDTYEHTPLWIESVWLDDDGTLYAWYHHESPVCNGRLSMPVVGALVSDNGGESFRDLGIILAPAEEPDCEAANGYFAGGHGDFTVLLDQEREYFYIYFGNYGGSESSQGIAVARLAFSDRADPVGKVWKFFNGGWGEPGLGGRVTAILPASVPWNRPDVDSFWGPSLHWNWAINRYVMLLSRACCEPGWPVEGVYISFNPHIGNPYGWSPPKKILDRGEARWYPQVIGLEAGASDRLAGGVARLFLGGDSHWEIVFHP
jgi:hypothetical protein